MDELYSLLLDVFQAPAFAGTELDADGFLASQCSGLGKATQCIFLLDPEDRDGLLLLGIAEALKKPTLLLSESHISMWEGEFKQLAQSTIDRDLRKSVEDFMKKVRTKRKRGPRYESSFDRVTQPTHPTIELTIDTEYDTFTTAEEAKLLKRIQELLGMPSIPKVADKEVGSVKLKLPLDPSLAQKLFWAVKTGELESFNVKDARLLGDALAQAIVADKTRKHDFDVFLCHNSLDKKEVKRVGNKLKKFGLRPWLDEWVLRPGMPWQRALEEQIESIGAVAVFIGENGRGPWQDLEIEGFIRQFVKRDCPVIPVVLANCCGSPNWPPFLDGMQSVSFQHRRPDPMEQLVYGITGNRFSSD